MCSFSTALKSSREVGFIKSSVQTLTSLELSVDQKVAFIGGRIEVGSEKQLVPLIAAAHFDEKLGLIDVKKIEHNKRLLSICCLRRAPQEDVLFAGTYEYILILQWLGSRFYFVSEILNNCPNPVVDLCLHENQLFSVSDYKFGMLTSFKDPHKRSHSKKRVRDSSTKQSSSSHRETSPDSHPKSSSNNPNSKSELHPQLSSNRTHLQDSKTDTNPSFSLETSSRDHLKPPHLSTNPNQSQSQSNRSQNQSPIQANQSQNPLEKGNSSLTLGKDLNSGSLNSALALPAEISRPTSLCRIDAFCMVISTETTVFLCRIDLTLKKLEVEDKKIVDPRGVIDYQSQEPTGQSGVFGQILVVDISGGLKSYNIIRKSKPGSGSSSLKFGEAKSWIPGKSQFEIKCKQSVKLRAPRKYMSAR